MENYYCNVCVYYTDDLDNFKKHLLSKKHSNSIPNDIRNPQEFKRKIFCCENCNNVYLSNQSLQNHYKKQHTVLLKDQQTIAELKEVIKMKDQQLNKALDIAKVNSKTTNTTINILKYANLHLHDAEPLEELAGDDLFDAIKYKNPKGTESKNEAYVKTVIHKFKNGAFAKYIGDMIIEHYKPTKKSDANVIATDTSRLCFIIMQKVKDKTEKKEWINDKSGKKFTELVLRPVINAIKEILIEFISFKNGKKMDECLLNQLTDCVELKRDITTDKFIKPILKFVAPDFHFDKLKMLDDEVEDIDELSYEKPKKIKIKVKKSN